MSFNLRNISWLENNKISKLLIEKFSRKKSKDIQIQNKLTHILGSVLDNEEIIPDLKKDLASIQTNGTIAKEASQI